MSTDQAKLVVMKNRLWVNFYRPEIVHIFHNVTTCHEAKLKLIPLLKLPIELCNYVKTFLNGSKSLRYVPYEYSDIQAKHEFSDEWHSLSNEERLDLDVHGKVDMEYHCRVLCLERIREFDRDYGITLPQRLHPMKTLQRKLEGHLREMMHRIEEGTVPRDFIIGPHVRTGCGPHWYHFLDCCPPINAHGEAF